MYSVPRIVTDFAAFGFELYVFLAKVFISVKWYEILRCDELL